MLHPMKKTPKPKVREMVPAKITRATRDGLDKLAGEKYGRHNYQILETLVLDAVGKLPKLN